MAEAVAVVEPLDASCRNCGNSLTGAYCAQCGQKRMDGPPTVREFLHEAAEDILNWDGKLMRTLRLLFFHPGCAERGPQVESGTGRITNIQ